MRYSGLKNPAFRGFWIITQEPDFCKHVVLAKITKKTLALRAEIRKHILIDKIFAKTLKALF